MRWCLQLVVPCRREACGNTDSHLRGAYSALREGFPTWGVVPAGSIRASGSGMVEVPGKRGLYEKGNRWL